VDAPDGRSAVRTLAQPRVSRPSASSVNQAPSFRLSSAAPPGGPRAWAPAAGQVWSRPCPSNRARTRRRARAPTWCAGRAYRRPWLRTYQSASRSHRRVADRRSVLELDAASEGKGLVEIGSAAVAHGQPLVRCGRSPRASRGCAGRAVAARSLPRLIAGPLVVGELEVHEPLTPNAPEPSARPEVRGHRDASDLTSDR
jgi:hypothetical protein